MKFGAFLLKTREEILSKLLKMQGHLPVELITPTELCYVRELLEEESKAKVDQGLKKFLFEFPDGKRVAVVSDFNILETPRKRLGPLTLKRAKLIEVQDVSLKYSQSTRVMYYRV